MYKYILESAGNINWMAVGPLLIFFLFFVAVTVYAIKRDKKYVDKMSNMPLEDDK